MTTPHEHHDNKVEVLRLLRFNWQHLQVKNARQPLDWDVAEAATGVSRTELMAVLAKLVAIELAKPGPRISAPVALQSGEIEITEAGLSFLHNLETQQALEVFRAKVGVETAKEVEQYRLTVGEEAATKQRAVVRDETKESNLEPTETNTQPPGFRPE